MVRSTIQACNLNMPFYAMAILDADSHFKGAFASVGAKESSDHIVLLP